MQQTIDAQAWPIAPEQSQVTPMQTPHAPWLSTHVLDVERGQPAAGVTVALSRRDGDTLVPVAAAETGSDGRIQRLGGETLPAGVYQLAFDTATYLRGHGHDTPFLQRVVVEFHLADSGGHYHVPLLLSPYSCTSYRGS